MSVYFEKARELGELLLQSELGNNLSEARTVYKNDSSAQEKMSEFTAYENNIRESMNKGVISEEEVQKATKKLTDMATELKKDPVIGGLVFAETEFNIFVNQVMDVLKMTITGEPIESSGGCSGCSGGDCSGCC